MAGLRRAGLALGFWLALASGPAQAQATACAALPPRTPMPREAVPAYLTDPGWQAHTAGLSQQLAGADVSHTRLVFLGDSITESWFPLIFQQFYGQRAALNLGVSSDFTQSLLWRLQQDQWPAALKPRLVVLLIGTNNLPYAGNPADVALGIAEVIRLLRARSPQTRILLVGILPRGPDASDPLRRLAGQVNALLARCADNRNVFYSDAGRMLVDGQGGLSDQIAFDRLHLTMVGYAILAAAMEPDIRRLLGE